jgi:hypothetical protein
MPIRSPAPGEAWARIGVVNMDISGRQVNPA